MNGYVKRREWCVVSLIKRVKYSYSFFQRTVYFRHILAVAGICSTRWNMYHSASLQRENSQLYPKDWIWSLSVPTAVRFDCQSVTQQRILLQNYIHQNVLVRISVTDKSATFASLKALSCVSFLFCTLLVQLLHLMLSSSISSWFWAGALNFFIFAQRVGWLPCNPYHWNRIHYLHY